MRERLLPIGLCLLAALLLGCSGFWMLFTAFSAHDDEGYVLWTMRQFCEGRPLYTEVFSQYGPLFYAWNAGLHAVTGLVFDSESARWLALGYWLIASGSCGYIGWRLTRSWLASVASAVLAFAALQEMIREPFHPGGFLAALTAVGAAVCLRAVQRDAVRLFAITGAAVGMAIALTKINVGAFFLVAVGSWVAINSGGRRWGSIAILLTALGVMVAPLGLMKMLLSEPWVSNLALVFVAGALSVVVSLRAARRPDFTWKAWLWMAAIGGLMIAGMAAFCAGTGTPVARLWDAVVIAPTRHPSVVTYPIDWRAGAIAGALLAAGLAFTDALVKTRPGWRTTALASLRLFGGFAVLWQLNGLGFEQPFQAVFQFAPALAWLMATPLRADKPDLAARGRAWLAWCAIWQLLQAYPVAGSQVSWGCFLFVPLLVAGCYDAVVALGERLPRPVLAARAAGGALLVLAAIAIMQLGVESSIAWSSREPLGLPGAKSLRLSGSLTGEARIMTRNIATHAGLLFSTPGMLSFNLWSEKPTPTPANVTVWGALLDDEQRQAIATRLLQDKSSMVVARLVGGRLYNPDDLLASFQTVLYVGPYTLWARKGTTVLPLGTVRAGKTAEGRVVAVIVASPTERRIGSLEIREVGKRGALWTTAVAADNPWRLTPVNLQAQPVGEATSEESPFILPGYFLVQVPIDSMIEGINPDKLEIALTEAGGALVESYRFNKAGR